MLLLLACAEPVVRGEVVDLAGAPLSGVEVSPEGITPTEEAPCAGVTGPDGRFELECPQGTFSLRLRAEGYLDGWVQEVSLGEVAETGRHSLVEEPEGQGIFVLLPAGFERPPAARVDRRLGGKGAEAFKHYCLAPDTPQPELAVSGPELVLFDRKHPGWALWRLDDEGCAYRMQAGPAGRWEKTWGERPQQTKEQRETGALVRVKVQPGRYFLADWQQGFFTRIAETGADGYSGSILVVQ